MNKQECYLNGGNKKSQKVDGPECPSWENSVPGSEEIRLPGMFAEKSRSGLREEVVMDNIRQIHLKFLWR
jgi:hypothetical protein